MLLGRHVGKGPSTKNVRSIGGLAKTDACVNVGTMEQFRPPLLCTVGLSLSVLTLRLRLGLRVGVSVVVRVIVRIKNKG